MPQNLIENDKRAQELLAQDRISDEKLLESCRETLKILTSNPKVAKQLAGSREVYQKTITKLIAQEKSLSKKLNNPANYQLPQFKTMDTLYKWVNLGIITQEQASVIGNKYYEIKDLVSAGEINELLAKNLKLSDYMKLESVDLSRQNPQRITAFEDALNSVSELIISESGSTKYKGLAELLHSGEIPLFRALKLSPKQIAALNYPVTQKLILTNKLKVTALFTDKHTTRLHFEDQNELRAINYINALDENGEFLEEFIPITFSKPPGSDDDAKVDDFELLSLWNTLKKQDEKKTLNNSGNNRNNLFYKEKKLKHNVALMINELDKDVDSSQSRDSQVYSPPSHMQ